MSGNIQKDKNHIWRRYTEYQWYVEAADAGLLGLNGGTYTRERWRSRKENRSESQTEWEISFRNGKGEAIVEFLCERVVNRYFATTRCLRGAAASIFESKLTYLTSQYVPRYLREHVSITSRRHITSSICGSFTRQGALRADHRSSLINR